MAAGFGQAWRQGSSEAGASVQGGGVARQGRGADRVRARGAGRVREHDVERQGEGGGGTGRQGEGRETGKQVHVCRVIELVVNRV